MKSQGAEAAPYRRHRAPRPDPARPAPAAPGRPQGRRGPFPPGRGVVQADRGRAPPRIRLRPQHPGDAPAPADRRRPPGRPRPLFRQAAGRRKEVLGPRHPEYATSLISLALLLQKRGDATWARMLLKEAVEVRRTVFGDQHIEYAQSLAALADVYAQQGELARAEGIPAPRRTEIRRERPRREPPRLRGEPQQPRRPLHRRLRRPWNSPENPAPTGFANPQVDHR